jgi:TolA-binding protein
MRTFSRVFIAIFAAAVLAVPVFAETPGELLARARTAPTPAESVRILESGLAGSGDLKPWYLLELARFSGAAGNWKKSLDWSLAQDLKTLPPPITDQVIWWRGEALVRADRPAEAETLYRNRIESGKTADPAVYLAWFKVGKAGTGDVTARFDASFPELKNTDRRTFSLSRYLAGLCAVREGDWDVAVRSFTAFSRISAALPEYASWGQYYLAWSLYRLGRFPDSVSVFSAYLDGGNAPPLAWQATTTAALAALEAGSDALPFAERAVSLASSGENRAGSILLQASILADRKLYTDAETLLAGVADGSATNGITVAAPRALFSLGELAAKRKNNALAEERWLSVVDRFPRDPLADDALFRAGERWYIAGEWKHAGLLFSRYRQTLPSGRYLDSVLRMGGDAFNRDGNADLAIIWWEDLVRKYPDSPALPRTLDDLVAAYRKKGEYRSALRSANLYLSRYPKEARLDGMDDEVSELNILSKGASPDIAALETAWTKAGKAGTANGRAVGLALARLYVADYGRRADAKAILGELTAKAPRTASGVSAADREVYAPAWNLLGTMRREDSDFKAAATALLAAGSLYAPVDAERAAESLYGAVDSFLQAGLRADASETGATMRKNWPDSVWTRRAGLLLED